MDRTSVQTGVGESNVFGRLTGRPPPAPEIALALLTGAALSLALLGPASASRQVESRYQLILDDRPYLYLYHVFRSRA
jgi:hypothetical protein